jgi:hypothetical protein
LCNTKRQVYSIFFELRLVFKEDSLLCKLSITTRPT